MHHFDTSSFFFAYDFLLLIIEFEEQSGHRFVLSMYCKINRLTKQLTKLFKV